MDQNKFMNVFGLEEASVPVQLDTFESPIMQAIYDRYIFDFSIPLKRYWENVTYFNRDFEATLGIPGDAELVYRDFIPQNIWNSYEGPDGWPDVPIARDENNIPIINKDAMVYIGSKLPDAYGAGTGQDFINAFRSGYIEFTVKTNNQNCIIAFGSRQYVSDLISGNAADASIGGKAPRDNISLINENIAVSNETGSGLSELFVKTKNGKLFINYVDKFGQNAKEFEILSNKTIADDKWHHVVINIGKPGIIRKKKYKSNRRYIDIYVDGSLDNSTNINDNDQIFFPRIAWLWGDPGLSFAGFYENSWDGPDAREFPNVPPLIGGIDEWLNIVPKGRFNPIGDDFLFTGQMHTFNAGINTALSHDEITLRYALYASQKVLVPVPLQVSAEMVQPQISGNKKRALRLFWNEEKRNNGLELDNSFIVDTISVTHKSINSPTDIYNADVSNNKEIKFLPNVKAAFKDHINIFGPGLAWLANIPEFAFGGFAGISYQEDLTNYSMLDAVSLPKWNYYSGYNPNEQFGDYFLEAPVIDWPFSNMELIPGDKILLTNQIRKKENGIWVFNGFGDPLTRDENLYSPNLINDGVVYVEDGKYAETYWMLNKNIDSVGNGQEWVKLLAKPSKETILSEPLFYDIYRDEIGEQRLIDLLSDIDVSKYDVITFMNYPDSFDELTKYFDYDNVSERIKIYKSFINSLKVAVANGANLFVSSPKLAEDLGIVKEYSAIPQLIGQIDPQAAYINPFEINESSDRFFDVHRNNKYYVDHLVPGLTDVETWIMNDFISYIPENEYDNNEWHAKYSYRQFGLQEGDEFLIPGLALLPVSESENLPGFRDNYRGSESIYAVAPDSILAGTAITKLSNVYCDDGNLCPNPYDDYATTIVVHNGQLLGNYPINGKIFVNCTEDSYTFSREDYNVGIIQNVPANDPNETINRLLWQYSTRRLSRKPQKVNIKELTEFGQTVPTNGGGGPIIQSATNSSNGIIRSETDKGNKDYESDLYPSVDEEIYPIQEIPVLSMTWLGLNWLAG